jgi:hypothetical protein
MNKTINNESDIELNAKRKMTKKNREEFWKFLEKRDKVFEAIENLKEGETYEVPNFKEVNKFLVFGAAERERQYKKYIQNRMTDGYRN